MAFGELFFLPIQFEVPHIHFLLRLYKEMSYSFLLSLRVLFNFIFKLLLRQTILSDPKLSSTKISNKRQVTICF